MAATQDLSIECGSSLGRWGTRALQVLTRSAICNVLGTIKPNVSFPERLCSVWGRRWVGLGTEKAMAWVLAGALRSKCFPVVSVWGLGIYI